MILMKMFLGCTFMPFLLMGLTAADVKSPVVDGRDDISPKEFVKKSEGVWEIAPRRTLFPFDEAIYSWNARLGEGEGFRLYVKIGFGGYNYSPWLYAGFWGEVKPRGKQITTTFKEGGIEYDHIILKEKACLYQFKLVSEGKNPISVIPSLHFVYTDNSPGTKTLAQYSPRAKRKTKGRILDLPLKPQYDATGKYIKNACQSAALAAAMEYLGKKVRVEDIAPMTYDAEYKIMGIWPRIIGTAAQLGFPAYIDRFRTWDYVKATVAENKVILCSIKMPEEDKYIDPPYPSMSGHIVALNGVTDDGRVVVTDSSLARSGRGFRCQWLMPDFQKVWMQNKGGMGMVICPITTSKMKLVTDLPPFKSHKKAREAIAIRRAKRKEKNNERKQ